MTHYRPPRRYGLSLGQIEDLAGILDTLSRLCDKPAARDPIENAHAILERALGQDASLLYAQKVAA